MQKLEKIYVAGHRGMVGSALVRALQRQGGQGHREILTATHAELDLTRQADVEEFLFHHRPNVIVLAAAKVGGIHANATYPADFLYDNLLIAANVIHAANLVGTGRLLFLGSSCIYPKFAPQPIPEDSLLTGALEPTNEAYALAKIAGLKLCEHYRTQYGRLFHSAMPCNLYGPGDNYHPENSHVIPALIRRFHAAREARLPQVVVWGSGTPLREFLHVDDLASGCLHLLGLENPPSLVNVGSGSEVSISDLARMVADAVGYPGEIVFDPSKPDGTPRKILDSSRLRSLGWTPTIDLRTGLASVYPDFLRIESLQACAV
ncbi:MAG: GDP-L-fucose synthase [Verrucomicrobia bacterium]|jgi:GDP-L-fucose synthase|nr:MAG: GDP-L-fucose synthase [Verrucomicrobiota bacterium]